MTNNKYVLCGDELIMLKNSSEGDTDFSSVSEEEQKLKEQAEWYEEQLEEHLNYYMKAMYRAEQRINLLNKALWQIYSEYVDDTLNNEDALSYSDFVKTKASTYEKRRQRMMK